MGSLEQNTTLIYGVHIRESANDGSDFGNAAADYRIAFLGEDGLWHVKDSSGTVTEPFTGTGGATELDYVEVTSNTNLTATTEATANTIVTGSAVAYDGSTTVVIEFFAPTWQANDSLDAVSRLYLYDGSSSIGRLATLVNPTADSGGTGLIVPATGVRRLTPSAATHTYSIRGDTSSGTAVIGAGAGGNGNVMPAFIRITAAGN